MPHTSHELPRIRRAALRTLARLQADGFVDVFMECLSDRSPSVSREAMRGLSKRLHLVAGERIWTVSTARPEVHARRNALFLVARLGKWESIGYLVEALGTENEDLRKLAENYLKRWHWRFNRSFTDPTKPQIERLSAALKRSGAGLNRSIKELLQFAMREV